MNSESGMHEHDPQAEAGGEAAAGPFSPAPPAESESAGSESAAREPAAPSDPPKPTLAQVLGNRVRTAAARVVVGMENELDQCLAAILAGGHALLEGPPGVAKTLLVRTLAATLGGTYGRIQFTPDLMPADVTGTGVFHPGEGEFRFRPGPLFAHFLLCDEINRAPAKTQAALLESMQEGSATIDGTRYDLPRPFAVFATQNPIEHEGTYPLPEAQLDRFLFKIVVDYPAPNLEARLLAESHARPPQASPEELGIEPVTSPEDLLAAIDEVARVTVREDLPAYIVKLVTETRRDPSLIMGASPRAGVMLLRGAKALAALAGRDFVTTDDIKRAAPAVLRHRLLLDPAEEIEGVRTDQVVGRILDSVEVPR